MKVGVFLNELALGGTEKAAARWARGLREHGHEVSVIALEDGPRSAEFETHDIEVRVTSDDSSAVRDALRSLRPDILHVHAPGHPHRGDVLGVALTSSPKIPVLQTNIFGRLENPKEDAWTNFRLFVSWTSCVQAARRAFRRLNADFFRYNSVAVNPLDPEEPPSEKEVEAFRAKLGVETSEILFGRLSRPELNKWSNLSIQSFRSAALRTPRIKLLLREPPPAVRQELENSADRRRFVILPATADAQELKLTIASLDAVLHTSAIGESFGYGIAEPMNLAKPIIANSTPWADQAQIELVRHNECGLIASTPETIAQAIIRLASDSDLRLRLGRAAKAHIGAFSDPSVSTDRLEAALHATAAGDPNPHAAEDFVRATKVACYLDSKQFGDSWRDQFALRPFHYRVRLSQLRRAFTRSFV